MKKTLKKEGLEWIRTILIGVLLAVFFRTFFFSTYVVEGKSMMPTLQDGNMLVVNKVSYQVGDLNRFDVVVFHANKKEDYVKRIIGLPGDHIEYKHDKLYINGQFIDEPYLEKYKKEINGRQLTGDFTLEELTKEKVVPAGHIFVIGDNRLGSWDSRHFGFVKADTVVGKVDLRYWPIQEVQTNFSKG
ncbi:MULTISPECIES: signal peptidase I [Bacillus]|jgi:signal peptidase I|uniref:Signal peptidase I n=2 Tax=Bacillus cereus group TaxID=86661 RepID=A0A2B5AGH8_9BACI|nr:MULTISPECIES: signal peptidase I [Bacillus]AFU11778.1 Signal peptidase I [Bacillus thuringiensis MC28]EEL24166.1 Signal peptidase I [Bacillus cereus Rock1-3]EJR59436.1 signal peptidase I [Bacillus cereus VD115]EOP28894.1 signal peptidase I [Bacillus cereus VD131]KXY16498.1 S26 family signal peptidase [Bacillus cereus]MDH8703862.1 signal peptidase I [Stenotrophomonas sp. 1198]MDP9744549.1 signal peptidase I [Bacillus thuringiensis]OTX06104.1 signal peptidase I [Bacillus thuringiensis sero